MQSSLGRRKHLYAFRVGPNPGSRYVYTHRSTTKPAPVAMTACGSPGPSVRDSGEIVRRAPPSACYRCGQAPIWCACLGAPGLDTCSSMLGMVSSRAAKDCFDYTLLPVTSAANEETDTTSRLPVSVRPKSDDSPRFSPSAVYDGSWVGQTAKLGFTPRNVAKAA